MLVRHLRGEGLRLVEPWSKEKACNLFPWTTRTRSPRRWLRPRNLIIASGLSHGFLTVLYFVGLGTALCHPDGKTVRDLVVRSVVVYRIEPAVVASHAGTARSPLASTSTRLEKLGKKLSERPDPPDDAGA